MGVKSLDTQHPFVKTLRGQFDGVISSGSHKPDRLACALEIATVARGLPWSDSPVSAGLPDLRQINDSRWASDTARTQALLPVIIALWDWDKWTPQQKQTWATQVAERTIREIVPIALRVARLEAEAQACEATGTESAASRAANAAYSAARAASADSAARVASVDSAANAASVARAASAARAAYSAYSAASAARAANAASAAYSTLRLACRIWREEADAITAAITASVG